VNVYHDSLLRTLIVVELDGGLWLCPRRAGGWASRQALQMTQEARSERLKPARDIDPGWLGIPEENRPLAGPGMTAEGRIRPATHLPAGCVKKASRGHVRKGP
jgi:hypothetical protein